MRAIPILMLCAVAVLAGRAAAASDMPGSDCAQLSAPDARAVCESRDLSKLDTEAATLFDVRMMLPMLMGERGAAQDENQAFVEQRAACGADAACLQSAYEARIAALKQTLTAGMDEYCRLKGICG